MRDDVKMVQPDGIVHTACELCPWGCGMEVHTAGGTIEKVRGDKGHPLNEGALCPKGGAALDVAFSPERITYPMKREKGGWQSANVNLLTDSRPADPITGFPAFKAMLCRIRAGGRVDT